MLFELQGCQDPGDPRADDYAISVHEMIPDFRPLLSYPGTDAWVKLSQN
jgi:hypothetical protein